MIYVLNFGNPVGAVAANITGFRLVNGTLTPIGGSTQPLSAANPNPAQVGFNPAGNVLVVTERATNMISTYTVDVTTGVASAPNSQASAGNTTFGFDFTPNGILVVSEANGGPGNPNGSTTSSYTLSATGVLTTISGAVANNQTASCWVAINPSGTFAYTTNTASNTISAYAIAANGALTLQNAGNSGATGAGPIDLDISSDGAFLYTVNRDDDSLSIHRINADGTLTAQAGVAGQPAGSVGIIAR